MTPPQSGGLDGGEQPQGLPGLEFERWLRMRRLHPRPQAQAAPDCGWNGASALLRTLPLRQRTPWPSRPPHESCACGHHMAVPPPSLLSPCYTRRLLPRHTAGEGGSASAHALALDALPASRCDAGWPMHARPLPKISAPSHTGCSYDAWAQTPRGICRPIAHDLRSRRWPLLWPPWGHAPSPLGGHIFSLIPSSPHTKSEGQALSVSLVKPGAYLSVS
jgi:hypothetical protein